MAENGFSHRSGPAVTPLSVWQRHDYVPAAFPIWGNAHTFSWEPYLELALFAGEKTSWTMDYLFWIVDSRSHMPSTQPGKPKLGADGKPVKTFVLDTRVSSQLATLDWTVTASSKFR